jgi:hypothetical protein
MKVNWCTQCGSSDSICDYLCAECYCRLADFICDICRRDDRVCDIAHLTTMFGAIDICTDCADDVGIWHKMKGKLNHAK